MSTNKGLRAFLDDQMATHPIEVVIVRKIIRALKKAGKPVVKVFDGEEYVKAKLEREILDLVFNLDLCHLFTADGSWVLLVIGNGYDVIANYTTDLEEILFENGEKK